jgi:hypothetical protein
MERDLKIHVATPTNLTIENPPASFDLFYAFFFVAALIFCSVLTWKLFFVKKWIGILTAVIFLFVGLIVYVSRSSGYTMEIDKSNNSFIYAESDSKGNILSPNTVDLSTVERADMDFNRNQRRIVVSLKDGTHIFPLGDSFSYEDSQFKALDLIRQYICQKPFDQSSSCKENPTKP